MMSGGGREGGREGRGGGEGGGGREGGRKEREGSHTGHTQETLLLTYSFEYILRICVPNIVH